MPTGSMNIPRNPSDSSSTGSGNEAGASGSDHESLSLSKGGMIAIIVVIVTVVVFGVISTVFFYLAKKRSWELRARMRSSAKRVVAALTPRRSEFPKDALTPKKGSRGAVHLDEVPPTPKINRRDLEKGNVKMTELEMESKKSKWGRKTDV